MSFENSFLFFVAATVCLSNTFTACAELESFGEVSFFGGGLSDEFRNRQNREVIGSETLASILLYQSGCDVAKTTTLDAAPLSRPRSVMVFMQEVSPAHYGSLSSYAITHQLEIEGCQTSQVRCFMERLNPVMLGRRGGDIFSLSLGNSAFPQLSAYGGSNLNELLFASSKAETDVKGLGLAEVEQQQWSGGDVESKIVNLGQLGKLDRDAIAEIETHFDDITFTSDDASSTLTVVRDETDDSSSGSAVPTRVVLHTDDKCTLIFLAELSIQTKRMHDCVRGEEQRVAPLMCVFTPTLHSACFRATSASEDIVVMTNYIFDKLAQRMLFNPAAGRNALAVNVRLPVDHTAEWNPLSSIVYRSESFTSSADPRTLQEVEAIEANTPAATKPSESAESQIVQDARLQKSERRLITIWVTIAIAIALALTIYKMLEMNNESRLLMWR